VRHADRWQTLLGSWQPPRKETAEHQANTCTDRYFSPGIEKHSELGRSMAPLRPKHSSDKSHPKRPKRDLAYSRVDPNCRDSLVLFLGAHHRSDLFAQHHATDISMLIQIEDNDGQIVIFAEGNRG
jgi:hypothetical protein